MPVLLSIHLLLKWTLHCNLFIDLSLVRDGRERKWNVWMECFDPTPFCFWILCNKTVFALLIAFLLYTVLATCVHFYRQKVQKVLNLTVFYGFSPISFFFFYFFFVFDKVCEVYLVSIAKNSVKNRKAVVKWLFTQ